MAVMEACTKVALVQTNYDLDRKQLICYPYYVMRIRVTIPRPFLNPRVVTPVITADLIKGVVMRADRYPELQEVYLPKEALIRPITTLKEAEKKAKKLAFKWALGKFHMVRNPEIEIVRCDRIFKAFCLLKTPEGQTILVDSMKGLTDAIPIDHSI